MPWDLGVAGLARHPFAVLALLLFGQSSLCGFSSFAFWLVIPAEAGIQLFDVVVVLTVAL
jgi:hypothetical protein